MTIRGRHLYHDACPGLHRRALRARRLHPATLLAMTRNYALIDSDEAEDVAMALAWRWIICSMKLYDEVAEDDEAPAVLAAEVIDTLEPSA